MMLRSLVCALLSYFAFNEGLSQGDYKEVKEILYYDNPEEQLDSYQLEKCRLDIYYPVDKTSFATIVWFHGGGLRSGSKSIPEELKNRGMAIVAVNYRLYPKVKAPEYLRDAARAVAWVLENIESYNGSKDKVFLSGHSAGGYLVSMIGLDKSWLSEFHKDPDSLAGLIPLSGHTITHFTVREEQKIPGHQAVVDSLAPLFHVRKDAPPILLITGDRELELLGRYEENAYFMRMMKVVGHQEIRLIELDGYGHRMTKPAFPLLLEEVERVLNPRK